MSQSNSAQSWDFDDDIFSGGVHICYIYNDDQERAQTMARFFARGIEAGQKALCIVDSVAPHDIRSALEELGIDVESNKDVFNIAENEPSYCPEGEFNPDMLISNVDDFCARARDQGYSGARISGDMAWAIRKDISLPSLMEYENKVSDYLEIAAVSAICEYDARKFDGATIMDILSVHPAIIVKGQVVRNPYFTHPKEYLESRNKRQD